MLSEQFSPFLTYLSHYFSISQQIILEKSKEHEIITSFDSQESIDDKIRMNIGLQQRKLDSLDYVLTQPKQIFDTIACIIAINKKEKYYSFLIANEYTICRLLYFIKENEKDKLPKELVKGDVIKINSCYTKDSNLITNLPPIKIWFYTFVKIYTITEFPVDKLYNYFEIQIKTPLIHIRGILRIISNPNKDFYYLEGEEYFIKIIPYYSTIEFTDYTNKLLFIEFIEIKMGPDAIELVTTEFTKFHAISSMNTSNTTNKLKRFEYNTTRQSIKELFDSPYGTVAETKLVIKRISLQEDKTICYCYDSSTAFKIFLFDQNFINYINTNIESLITKKIKFKGLYLNNKRGKIFCREQIENLSIIDDQINNLLPLTNYSPELSTGLYIFDLYINDKSVLKNYSSKGKKGNYCTYTVINTNQIFKITAFAHLDLIISKTYRIYFVQAKLFNEKITFTIDHNAIVENIENYNK